MGIFSRFFGNSTQHELERKYAQVHKDVEIRTRPLDDIAMAIVKATDVCYKTLRPFVISDNDERRQRLEVCLFNEFIYFFMHMTNRVASSRLNKNQMEKLQEFLGPIIVGTAIDTFCDDWPKDAKMELRSHFYDHLNNAEVEYSACKELLSKEEPFTSEALMSVLARNIALACGKGTNPAVMISAIDISTRSLTEMKLELLIERASPTLFWLQSI